MDEAEFHAKVDEIVAWFSSLNRYDFVGSILKIEDVNYGLKSQRTREPLFCWAISAKRYALFNLDPIGRPILRKASAHGLGHIRAPYDVTKPAKNIPAPAMSPDKIGVELWQHDLWWKIVTAALAGHPDRVDFGYHPALNQPAISRYAATTPKQLRWFRDFNQDLSYERQVKPFGFLYSLFAASLSVDNDEQIVSSGTRPAKRVAPGDCKPVAPFDRDLTKAVARCFDRVTSLPVAVSALKSFKQVISLITCIRNQSFSTGTTWTAASPGAVTFIRLQSGTSARKPMSGSRNFISGFDEDEQIEYGMAPNGSKRLLGTLKAEVRAFGGQRRLAIESGVSRRTVSRLMRGRKIRKVVVARILASSERAVRRSPTVFAAAR